MMKAVFCFLTTFILLTFHVNAQIITSDSIPSDSSFVQNLQEQLHESRLNAINLQMQVEQLKLEAYASDSIKLAKQKAVIDSLRHVVAGAPVVVGSDTLFYFYTNRGGLSAKARTLNTQSIIYSLGKEFDLQPDSVYVFAGEFTTDIMYGDKVIASLTTTDGLWMDTSRDQLAQQDRNEIVKALKILAKEHSFSKLMQRILIFLLVLIAQIVLIRLTNFGYRKLKTAIDNVKMKFLKPIYVRKYKLLSIDRLEKLVFSLCNILRWIIIILQLIISIPIVFSIFPETKAIAEKIFSYIYNPAYKIGTSIVNYIPNIFTILIIYLIIRYIVKGIRYLAGEIEQQHLKIPGFYPDWAKPTYTLIRFLLYAFMIALIYPYLPGAESRIFQGISVFVGLIVSFGSSSAIGNIVSGLIITYMRPFQTGDRIQINSTVGNVVERTPIVTRILTIKNELITIPNNTIMKEQITNLSESARSQNLIGYLDITCGYETPWRQVHQLLLDAAEATGKVKKDPHPFVLELAFNDFDIQYQINVYITNADQLPATLSDLRQNIQDKFGAAGISIMSPHYYFTTPAQSQPSV
ncbi:MAG: mechanosensitive ion channel family protein [Dysgonamonadaceae bacterium]|jgi:small-conductance mechanosensitive channel|nr:mechanosensitive ion channel family protein [Dysgonamonadaceae bacterium]